MKNVFRQFGKQLALFPGTLVLSCAIGISLNAQEETVSATGSAYAQGEKLYAAKKFREAVPLLKQAFREDPGNADVNFLLGLAAMEAGEYELAVTALDRVMMIDPGHPRVQVELAKCYYEMGLFGVAESHFREAGAQEGIPPTVQRNIDAYLAKIEQLRAERGFGPGSAAATRHFLTGTLSLSLVRDDNASTSPSNQSMIPAWNGPQPSVVDVRRDFSYTTGLGLQYVYRPKPTLWYSSQAFALGAFYDTEKAYDVGAYGFAQGIGTQVGSLILEGGAGMLYAETDYADSLRAYGGQLSATYAVTRTWRVWLSGFGDDRTYYTTPGNTGFYGGLEAGMGKAFGVKPDCWQNVRPVAKEKWYHIASDMRYLMGPAATWDAACLVKGALGYKVANVEDGWQANDEFSAGINATVLLPYLSLLSFSYTGKNALYDDPSPFSLSGSRRRDVMHSFTVGVRKLLGTNCSVDVRHTFTNANSNVILYEYDRNISELLFRFSF